MKTCFEGQVLSWGGKDEVQCLLTMLHTDVDDITDWALDNKLYQTSLTS